MFDIVSSLLAKKESWSVAVSVLMCIVYLPLVHVCSWNLETCYFQNINFLIFPFLCSVLSQAVANIFEPLMNLTMTFVYAAIWTSYCNIKGRK